MNMETEYLKYLVLVNKEHFIPDDYMDNTDLVDTVTFEGKPCKLESVTLNAFIKLKQVLREEGIYIELESAYRSIDEQIRIQQEFTVRYGLAYTESVVAKPGTSEHHTGLALDIVIRKNNKWVTENSDLLKLEKEFELIHRRMIHFGFIVRYPKGKKQITGYEYEPWHLRYVGKKLAPIINQITLEEYLTLQNLGISEKQHIHPT